MNLGDSLELFLKKYHCDKDIAGELTLFHVMNTTQRILAEIAASKEMQTAGALCGIEKSSFALARHHINEVLSDVCTTFGADVERLVRCYSLVADGMKEDLNQSTCGVEDVVSQVFSSATNDDLMGNVAKLRSARKLAFALCVTTKTPDELSDKDTKDLQLHFPTSNISIDALRNIMKCSNEEKYDQFGNTSHILHPFSEEIFFEEYWGKKVLHIPGVPDKFDYLFGRKEFIGILKSSKSLYARATYDRAKTMIEIPEPSLAIRHFEAGASICVGNMEAQSPLLSSLVLEFKEKLGFSGEICLRTYWSPIGDGFDLHFDANMTMTMQIRGRKKWLYSKEPHLKWPDFQVIKSREDNVDKVPLDERPLHEDLCSIELSPGDLLCIPGGCWHSVEAQDEESLALTLSIDGMFGAKPYLENVLSRIVSESDLLRHPPPVIWRSLDRQSAPEAVSDYFEKAIIEIENSLLAKRAEYIKDMIKQWSDNVATVTD